MDQLVCIQLTRASRSDVADLVSSYQSTFCLVTCFLRQCMSIQHIRRPPQPVAPAQALLLRLGCCSYSVIVFIPLFIIFLCKTGLVDYPTGIGKGNIPCLGGEHGRFLIAKRNFGRVGDFERFRWVPQPVRLTRRVLSYQIQLLGTGSPCVRLESRLYVL